jgi:hypothetical protein
MNKKVVLFLAVVFLGISMIQMWGIGGSGDPCECFDPNQAWADCEARCQHVRGVGCLDFEIFKSYCNANDCETILWITCEDYTHHYPSTFYRDCGDCML